MDLFCAVDIRGGRCVRLLRGDYGAETVYDDDPVARAVQMAEAGAAWIHVVDLDGARSGRPENADAVAAIAAAVDAPVQAGGGARSAETVETWFEAGVERVVLGTAALRDPALVRDLASSRRIAVGLDARAGEVATDGWLRGSGRSVLDVARSFASAGVDAFVVTDISRDGTLEGPDLQGLAGMLDATDVDVVASGGVGRIEDLRALAGVEGRGGRRLTGAIVGTALYERRFTVAEAVAALAGPGGGD
ncbi:MAG: 1-(5-phosphoribosyl)-5-[(5-phosphoribosylamino)methylideneamino]imidazole-4-carboxamide isomerase [Acidimicrobiaceae bacterium]|nr:1-(5-phosphoribosyl)-5-[(5-phosphoribosylamino)methylideneamino]imidazole-4-carboxamide isomerase [Acidimicrobiaceae bacterium]MXY11939.1 1-(5-phosphoribosyl)-5-[(5-phosphoribosylamino)methylideneamino]imidazole-4-carboxamide isomerase [Acidimicrobiaceae bacterium]MXZ65147.1 1-(5-phosphoribosyl)-5-[(5-phosphoribosylamino)methylideneamino]imidazole-4-carboxamide isomerase [Acidimicrobiaceae bacterium]MYE57474.1 1-(5-phosphoribosyl)-5-[(5-phosphoribosylamino)methylideneamino]imidazole-4-carboxa